MKSAAPRSSAPLRSAFAAALIAPGLVACGFGAQTDQIYQAAQGVNDRSSDVEIHNATIVAAEDGAGTFAGSLVNISGTEQRVQNITAEGAEAQGAGEIVVGAGQLVNLASPTEDGGPQLWFTGEGVKVGGHLRVTFTFANGQTSKVNVIIVGTDTEDGEEFVDVPLPPTETPADGGAAGILPDDGSLGTDGGAAE